MKKSVNKLFELGVHQKERFSSGTFLTSVGIYSTILKCFQTLVPESLFSEIFWMFVTMQMPGSLQVTEPEPLRLSLRNLNCEQVSLRTLTF